MALRLKKKPIEAEQPRMENTMAIIGSDKGTTTTKVDPRTTTTTDPNNQPQGNLEMSGTPRQAPMPGQSTGEVREGTDGKKYHYSDAELTHTAPEMDPSDIEQKVHTDAEAALKEQREKAQKMQQAGAPENKAS